MMDGLTLAAEQAEPTSRSDRAPLLAFIADPVSEAVLQDGLIEVVPRGFEVRRGNVRTALQALSQMTTPKALVIDISGEDQPLALLADLRHVVEPDVRVMVIGERQDVTFYRQVTRALGAVEYLYKPLSSEMVARHFGAQFGRAGTAAPDDGGRMICLTGARGGSGATTLAVNLAWFLAQIGHRHTLLLDANLQTGTAAMLLGSRPSSGLRSALETPDRMDELFIERTAVPVLDRLHILATEEALIDQVRYVAGAAERLTTMLRRRFNYVVADAPFHGGEFARDLLGQAQQRLLILQPTLGSVRDTLRLLGLPADSRQTRRAVLVLNRSGMPGGLPRQAIEESLGVKIDVCIPDMPKLIGAAESLGEPAAKTRGGFRNGIEQLARELAFVGVAAVARRRWWRR